MTHACPRCVRLWAERAGQRSCMVHGEYYAPDPAPDDGHKGTGWAPSEEAFVEAHLADMSYREIALALDNGRTTKAVEHLVRSRGWAKRYVRRGNEHRPVPMPRGLPPSDRALAILIRERGSGGGWQVSLGALAIAAGVHRNNAARSLRNLIARGLVEVTHAADPWHGNRANTYRWAMFETDSRVEEAGDG